MIGRIRRHGERFNKRLLNCLLQVRVILIGNGWINILINSLRRFHKHVNVINFNNWKKYKISSLFDIRPSRYIKIKGKTLNNSELFDGGDNPVIVNSSVNNGIGGFTSYGLTEVGNVITYSDTTVGSDTLFYQRNPFVGYSHVKVMAPKNFIVVNEKIMLFLVSVIKASLSKQDFNYSNKLTNQIMESIVIKLPVLGNGLINFKYMENYIGNIANLSNDKLIAFRRVLGKY